MGHSIRVIIGSLLGLMMATGTTLARDAATATALSLREGPGTNYYRIATIPAGERVDIKGCRGGWCALIWDGYRGYASQRGLVLASAHLVEPEVWPIFPPYPYRAGHYPKADWYADMPPYTAISPSFYRKRFFMMSQERNRYRYMPHIFHDSGAYGDGGGPIADVDIQGVAADIRSNYESTYRD
jgi:SH3 domain-containing protein